MPRPAKSGRPRMIVYLDANIVICLLGPLISGDAKIHADYLNFFSDPTTTMFPATAAVWERAAEIRANHGFKALDAMHLATAVEHRCDVFLTNDRQLSRFPDISVDVLT